MDEIPEENRGRTTHVSDFSEKLKELKDLIGN